MRFSIPASKNLKKYIGKTFTKEELEEIIKEEKGIDSLILKKAKKYEKVTFEEQSIILRNTAVLIFGTKEDGYAVIMKPEVVTDEEWARLSLERVKRNLTYIDTDQITNILNS